jgi:hypothetical protein
METKLERLLDLQRRMVVAQCNAELCGGNYLWRVAHETEEAFELARERFCAELRRTQLIAAGRAA